MQMETQELRTALGLSFSLLPVWGCDVTPPSFLLLPAAGIFFTMRNHIPLASFSLQFLYSENFTTETTTEMKTLPFSCFPPETSALTAFLLFFFCPFSFSLPPFFLPFLSHLCVCLLLSCSRLKALELAAVSHQAPRPDSLPSTQRNGFGFHPCFCICQ